MKSPSDRPPIETTPEIIRLAKRGIRPCDIADAIDATRPRVYRTRAAARRDGDDAPRHPAGRRPHLITDPPLAVAIEPADIAALQPAATARGITPGALVRAVIHAVAADDLIAAILDEQP